MVKRMWDPEKRYTEGFLKEFTHWIWEVSYRQHTLGSFIIFAKRPIENLSELTPSESQELPKVMKEIEETFSRVEAFKPDKFNYWQMGNALHHLHIHGFPRYKKPRKFAGKKWIDKTWSDVPIWSRRSVSHELVAEIREEIKPFLKNHA